MQKHTFFILRYSLLTTDNGHWVVNKNEFETYKEILFSPERLHVHKELFENVTLPSLVELAKYSDNFTLLILTSTELPRHYRKRLYQILKPYSWARVFLLQPIDKAKNMVRDVMWDELKKFDEELLFSTVRLDDDDALAPYFMEELERYLKPEYLGYCISFPNGYAGIYNTEEECYESFHTQYKPKIAIGLSYINSYYPDKIKEKDLTVYHLGAHTKVDYTRPTILDARKPMFLWTIHSESDTSSQNKTERIKSSAVADIEEVRELFPYSTY